MDYVAFYGQIALWRCTCNRKGSDMLLWLIIGGGFGLIMLGMFFWQIRRRKRRKQRQKSTYQYVIRQTVVKRAHKKITTRGIWT